MPPFTIEEERFAFLESLAQLEVPHFPVLSTADITANAQLLHHIITEARRLTRPQE